MMKKMIFAALFAVFAVVSVSAQTKVDQYLGTWKMVSQPKKWKIKMMILNVSVADEMFKIEKITDDVRDGKDIASTVIYSYKLSGGTSTFLPITSTVGTTYLRYKSDGKLRLFQTYDAGNPESLGSVLNVREDWSLSSDGRTLSVEIRRYSDSLKFVFAKQ